MNYKQENKELITKTGKYGYYEYTLKEIKEIAKKHISEVENEEWRKLIQMLYPKNLICSGLFQPIVIFEVGKNGQRIDPPIEAYNSIDDFRDNTCLLFRIIDYIKDNSEFEIHDSWYKAKDKIMEEQNK